ncbi:kinase-like domain-containing protein [Mycena sp. CBHHK59/15]|nr:kinase-like domain-containing protein [Mycena sp. CBHHK59/15]
MPSDLVYEPFWTAVSPYTPYQNGTKPALFTDQMKSCFSTLLKRDVLGVEERPLGHGVFNVVYELVFKDGGQACVARICYNFKDNDEGRQNARETTVEEVAILALLEKMAPAITVPRVLGYDVHTKNLIGAPFILLSKLEGCNLSELAMNKELWQDFTLFLPGLAHALADLFSVAIPNKIGPVVGVSDSGSVVIGPFREEAVFRPSDRPFDSTLEYFEWRISATIWEGKENANVDVEALLQRLKILAQRLIACLDPSLLRVCLVHLDPHDRNVMVKDSRFSGLVDWQALALPAFMAAEYPPYLRYDGMREDRYAALNEYGDVDYMDKHIARRPLFVRVCQLTATFLSDPLKKGLWCCKERNPLYARALTEGQTLRQLVEWLTFVEWKNDYVWEGLQLWEVDQREKLDAAQ